jgi:hypothetical protein
MGCVLAKEVIICGGLVEVSEASRGYIFHHTPISHDKLGDTKIDICIFELTPASLISKVPFHCPP